MEVIKRETYTAVGDVVLEDLNISPMKIPPSRVQKLSNLTASTQGVFPKFNVQHSSAGLLYIKSGELEGVRFSVNQPIVEKICHLIAKEIGVECIETYLWLVDRSLFNQDDVVSKNRNSTRFESLLHYENKVLVSVTKDFTGRRSFYHMSTLFSEKYSYDLLWEKMPTLVQEKLDRMIVFDTLVANSDRHSRNIGFFVEESDQGLAITDLAPLYDNGLSLASGVSVEVLQEDGIEAFTDVPAKAFTETSRAILRDIVTKRKIKGINTSVTAEDLISIVSKFDSVMDPCWCKEVKNYIKITWGWICEILR